MDYRNQTLIHLHIPKTAGSTLQQIILLQYRSAPIFPFIEPEDYARVKALPLEKKAHYKLFQGHIPFGLHEHLTQQCIYITQLRDPIELALSSYYYFELGYRQTVLNQVPDRAIPTLDDFRGGQMRDMFDNMQTRFISGRLDAKFGECSRDMLALAKQHLDQFIVVGLVEQFDEWVVLLSKIFGWRAPYYARANVSRSRLRSQPLPEDVVTWLNEHNRLDFELYDHAKTLFARRVEEQGAGFCDIVDGFRRRNRMLGTLFSNIARSKRKLSRVPLVGKLL